MLYNLLLIYLLIPAVNALGDYLSWGLSRWLLYGFTQKNESRMLSIGKALTDLMAVFGFLLLLSFSLPFVLGGANSLLQWFLPAAQTIDLRVYLDAAARAPFAQGLVVTGMLFTTFLPTLLHLLALTVSLCLPGSSILLTQRLIDSLTGDPTHEDSSNAAVSINMLQLFGVVFALPVMYITLGMLALWQAYENFDFVSYVINGGLGLLRDTAMFAWGLWGY